MSLSGSMVTSLFIAEIKDELASIEQLISVLLQRQTDLGSLIASLELPNTTGIPLEFKQHGATDPFPGCSTWATVVKKGRNRLSLPLYDSQDNANEAELLNFFTPLVTPPTSPSPLLHPGDERISASRSVKRCRS